MATKKKAAKKSSKKAVAVATGQRGRSSKFTGKRLHKLAKENPRREGTAGHKSFAVITNGMSYEKYIEAGGRRVDLAWDLDHKNVELRAS